MTSTADSERGRDDWLIPGAMTFALGVCLLVFAPFAGDSVEDDRFWLAAFGAIWLASAGALAIREGRTMWSRPKAIAFHAAAFVAFVPHLLVGGLAMATVSLVARAVVLDLGQALQAPGGVLLVGALFMAWLGLTAWGLHSWVRRSWATLLVSGRFGAWPGGHRGHALRDLRPGPALTLSSCFRSERPAKERTRSRPSGKSRAGGPAAGTFAR